MNRLLRAAGWLLHTSWPKYAALVLGGNIAGAIAVMLFVVALPMPEVRAFAERFDSLWAIGVAYVVFAVLVGMVVTSFIFRPVLDWQRSPDTHDPNMVRGLVLRIPIYQAGVAGLVWGLGIMLTVIIAAADSGRLAVIIGVSGALAAMIVCLLTYLQAENLVRPIAAEALARRFEDSTLEPPVKYRLITAWIMTSGVPLVGIILLMRARYAGWFDGDLSILIAGLAAAALITGFAGTYFSMHSVVDPILELQDAIRRVRLGDKGVQVDIYDGSELGVLQAGFNEMMKGLAERQRVRDIFGRYVGTEVAQRALEEKPQLGGEDRKVAVIFVDVIGSTTFAVNHTPEEVVEALNEFFERVVAVVHRNKGIINKFQGDAALAIFGAPLTVYDSTSLALQAARELRLELRDLELQAGIGVVAGHVVAGHIGGADRFEYTVIGDAVNEAARLTELAKDTPGRVLTNAATLKTANEAEQARWTLMKSIELRGRHRMTQLARPIRATLADRS
ncbi:adenylate/guanylate cyclase domain-containing protein [Corynebacterium phoceense]|uniref:Adenylate/guanylate cyclase domain-containing protein n=1 Tax=Corynebacterium phoceense TaxID=1686286 RepID=A0A540RA87_9CORY|nr:adenylate/guanylate cyclase domain-containing protein [Corynebacterium phoceense]TQE44304.1 adenylate/guanylate cyclase domain-containing protein [Corynebacterium phoceense]